MKFIYFIFGINININKINNDSYSSIFYTIILERIYFIYIIKLLKIITIYTYTNELFNETSANVCCYNVLIDFSYKL